MRSNSILTGLFLFIQTWPAVQRNVTCMRLFFCDCEASWTNWTCWHYRCDICSSQRIIGEDADWTMNSGLEGAYHLCCKCSQRQVVSDKKDTIKHCEILFCAMANGMLWEHDIKYLTMSYWRRQQVRHALNYRFVTHNDEEFFVTPLKVGYISDLQKANVFSIPLWRRHAIRLQLVVLEEWSVEVKARVFLRK